MSDNDPVHLGSRLRVWLVNPKGDFMTALLVYLCIRPDKAFRQQAEVLVCFLRTWSFS